MERDRVPGRRLQREDEVLSVFQNLLHGLAEGFQVFETVNNKIDLCRLKRIKSRIACKIWKADL
jgi:hypothetical protein